MIDDHTCWFSNEHIVAELLNTFQPTAGCNLKLTMEARIPIRPRDDLTWLIHADNVGHTSSLSGMRPMFPGTARSECLQSVSSLVQFAAHSVAALAGHREALAEGNDGTE